MTTVTLSTLIGYMLVCSFTPGPGNILALNATSTYGWQRSRRMILGICAGYAAVQALCTLALYTLGQTFATLLAVLPYFGGVYMVWLAVQIMRSRPSAEAGGKRPSFRRGFLLQLVNVKIYFYIMSLLSVYFLPAFPHAPGLVLAGAVAVSIGSAASVVWAFAGVKLQRVYGRYYRAINGALGLFLLYCAWTIVRS